MNLFTVDLKNRPGELAHLSETLGERGVNLEVGGVTAGDRGFVYFTADDEDAARTALEAADLPYAEHPALQVRCADQPGAAAQFVRTLAEADINIEGLLPISMTDGDVIFATCVDKPEEARRVLGEQVVG
jgi:hypothetical protein